MMTRTLALVGSVLLTLSPASAQDQRTVDEKVVEMRRQVVEGKVIRSHVRVTVRLKNGNRIRGVVKNGFLVERVDELRFVAAEKDEEGAGLRLYYWNGRNNFVFLPFSGIKHYKVNERLTASQLAAIELDNRDREAKDRREREADAAQQAAKAAVERARQQGNQPQVTEPAPGGETGRSPYQPTAESRGGKPADPKDPATPADGKDAEQVQELYKLVQQYPPSAGWNEAKRDEISRRFVVIGAKPSAVEQKFVDKFDDWKKACKMFGVDAPEAPKQETRRRRTRR